MFTSCYEPSCDDSISRPPRPIYLALHGPYIPPHSPAATAISSAPITLRRLLPPADPATVEEIVAGLRLHERSGGVPIADVRSGEPVDEAGDRSDGRDGQDGRDGRDKRDGRERPYVVLNMVATVDGRATLDGRSGPLSGPADRALFHGLRAVVDAVMAGAGTIRTERYGPIVPDPQRRRLRAERGLAERPLACVVSASLAGLTPTGVPLLDDPDSRVIVLTPSPQTLPAVAAGVDYVRARAADGSLDLSGALVELRDRMHVRTLLCEGGPHLFAQLLSAGLVDELFLSISPLLAGGGALAGTELAERSPPLRILAGTDLHTPASLQLCSALEHDSHLFLRYRVTAPAS